MALVGHACAARTILSIVSAVSDRTFAFGFIRLFLSTVNTRGEMVSQPPKARHKLGSIIIWNLLRGTSNAENDEFVVLPWDLKLFEDE